MSTASPVQLVAWSAFASMAAMRICDPMLVDLGQTFGVTTGEAAQVITAYMVGYGVLQLFYGPLGDRLGKLRVIWLATFACGVLSLVTAVAPNLSGLVMARAAMGAAAAGIIPLSVAWVGDQVPYAQRQEALARLMGATVMGMMVGQWFGGWATEHWGWRYGLAGLAVLFALAVWRMHRSLQQQPAFVAPTEHMPWLQYWQATARLWTRSRVRWVLAMTFAEGALVMGTVAFMPSRLVDLGLSVSQAGAAMVLYGACGLAYSQLAKFSLARWGEQGLARGGGSLVALGLLLLSLAPGPGWAVLACPMAGWGFYMMHNTLQTQATQMAPDARSMAVTLFACTLFLGQTAGVALVALCLDAGGLQAALGGAACAVMLLGLTMAKGLQPKALFSPP